MGNFDIWYNWITVRSIIQSKYPTRSFVKDNRKPHPGFLQACDFYEFQFPNKKYKSTFVVYSFNRVEVVSEFNLLSQLLNLQMQKSDFDLAIINI